MHAIALVLGYAVSIWVGALGLFRRGLLGCAWAHVLIPIYWVMLSIAAWRALLQLVSDPYRWEKTEHGLARTSRTPGRTREINFFLINERFRIVDLPGYGADPLVQDIFIEHDYTGDPLEWGDFSVADIVEAFDKSPNGIQLHVDTGTGPISPEKPLAG